MKDKIYRRAVFFMCATIAISFFYGGCRSVSAQRDKAEREYYSDGENSASSEAGKIVANASNLLTVAKRYMTEEECSELSLSTERFAQSGNINVESKRLEAVLASAETVYKRLAEYELTAEDENYRTELYYNILSYRSVLSRNEYNSSALEFNSIMKSPPASLFAGILKLRELPIFIEVN